MDSQQSTQGQARQMSFEEFPATDDAMDDRRIASVVPESLTSLVGRDAEIDEVLGLLHLGTRLVTLTGPGGVGKTRLAFAIARRAMRDFADGVCVLPLAPISDPGAVLPALARALGVTHGSEPGIEERIASLLRARHMLLVLDNVEHLLAEPPVWLAYLLARCPRLTVLVTSRTALNISGEHRHEVATLPVAIDGGGANGEPAAVALFRQRAQAVRPDFEVDDGNRDLIAAICRRLDGLPLAIELAAARVTFVSLDELLKRLSDPLLLLRGGRRDAPAHQQTMRDAIAWSYELLPPGERRLFRRLAVLEGGFSLAVAERVGGASGIDVIAGVSSLVDKSLLHVVDATGPETRVTMLGTVREYGLEQLAPAEEAAARDELAAWCLDLARLMDPYDPFPEIDRLEAEHHHLRAALDWLRRSGRVAEFAELAVHLRWFWYYGGRAFEGLGWYERVMETTRGVPPVLMHDALLFAGQFAATSGDAAAADHLSAALALARAAGDALREAEATFYLGLMAENHGDYAEAEATMRRANELYERLGRAWRQRAITYHFGVLAYATGDLERAGELLEEVGAVSQAAGEPIIPELARHFLAMIACEAGDPEQALAIVQDLDPGSPRHDSNILTRIAGVVALACGEPVLAARLFGSAAGTGAPMLYPERRAFERAEREIRAAIGDAGWDRAWADGHRLAPGRVAAEVARLRVRRVGGNRGVPPPEPPAGLTAREMDVLRYLADGMSNREIADNLGISSKTVMNHVANILGKLGFESRTAVASFAIRNNLA